MIAALALVTMTACGAGAAQEPPADSGTQAEAPAADGVGVKVVNIAYKPAELRVLRSTEVTWTNADAGVAHTVTSGVGGTNDVPGVSEGEPNKPDGTFDGDLPAEGTFSYTFTESGTFEYFCEIHPSMRGTVVVD